MSLKHKTSPPKWAVKFLHWYCSDYYINEVYGDLMEIFDSRVRSYGTRRAKWLFVWDVIRFFHPSIIRGKDEIPQHSRLSWFFLLQNHFKISYRMLWSNKVHTAISVVGLSIGITCFLLIGLYVKNELSYDRFFKQSEDIYRVVLHQQNQDFDKNYAVTHVMLAPTLEESFPEVIKTTRVHRLYFHPEVTIITEERSFVETKMFLADNQFFDLFELEFVEGSPVDALASGKQVILTDKTARKYFGNEKALGKTLQLDFGRELIVSGVIKDLPENSHLDFDLLGSLEFMFYLRMYIEQPDWTVPYVCTYVQLKKGSNPVEFESKLPKMVDQFGRDQIVNSYGDQAQYELSLQPLTSIHLYSQLDAEMKTNGNINNLYLLIALAIFIMSISVINFINLSTARSVERAKEVCIRKIMGSGKQTLISQFLTESVLTSILSLFLAFGIIAFSLPLFNRIVDKSFEIYGLFNLTALLSILLFSIVVGLAAGWYPALFIAAAKPASTLQGKYESGAKGIFMRNNLVIFQFFVSLLLISSTLIISQQMEFISNKRLGFESNQVLLIKHPLSLGQDDKVDKGNFDWLSLAIIAHANHKIEVFKNELRKISGINEVGGAFQIMGHHFSLIEFQPINSIDPPFTANFQSMDSDFIRTMDIKVIQGRSFSSDISDQGQVLVNETAIKKFGWTDPIGKQFKFKTGGDETIFKVIGVVKDYHYQSLRDKIRPLVLYHGIESHHYFPTALAVNVNMGDLQSVLAQIENKWNEYVSKESLNITFLNDDMEKMYDSEQRVKKVFHIFTFLAILLACIGLFGLTTYVTQQKTKEIGIRKVLGAQVLGIIFLISKNFIKLILIAFILAVPITYILINLWLNDFAYHISIDVIPFVTSLVIVIILAIMTVSYKSIKAALTKPVNSLKTE